LVPGLLPWDAHAHEDQQCTKDFSEHIPLAFDAGPAPTPVPTPAPTPVPTPTPPDPEAHRCADARSDPDANAKADGRSDADPPAGRDADPGADVEGDAHHVSEPGCVRGARRTVAVGQCVAGSDRLAHDRSVAQP
jgi:hypothetical protein